MPPLAHSNLSLYLKKPFHSENDVVSHKEPGFSLKIVTCKQVPKGFNLILIQGHANTCGSAP